MQEAKARVYKVEPEVRSPSDDVAAPKPQLVPVLEEMPKWALLRHVAEEIQTQRGLLASRAHAAASAPVGSGYADGSSKKATAATDSKPAGGELGAVTSRLRTGVLDRAVGNGGAVLQGLRGEEGIRTPRDSGARGSIVNLADSASPARQRTEGVRTFGHDTGLPEARSNVLNGRQADKEHGSSQKDQDPYEWIQRLPECDTSAYADAPVLVVAKDQHMLVELRSVLAVCS
jgi:hypothetical protein